MKLEEVKRRITNTEESISKTEKLISKREYKISKKKKELNDLGIEVYTTDEIIKLKGQINDWNKIYWMVCDLESEEDALESNKKNLDNLNNTLTKYNNMLEVEEQKQNAIDNLPEIFKTFKNYLVEKWDEWDIKKRNRLKEEYKVMEYREFVRKYTLSDIELKDMSDEKIHNNNELNAKTLILDLLNRVSAITGEVNSYSNLHCDYDNSGYTILNGYVTGKQGTAEVESIYAGGYNIQRLHVRVLVKKVNL